jgi:hypothetical protein
MPAAAPQSITPEELAELRRWLRSRQLPSVFSQRVRILVMAADGVTNTGITELVGVSPPP